MVEVQKHQLKYDFQKSSSWSFLATIHLPAPLKRLRCRLVGHILVPDDAPAG